MVGRLQESCFPTSFNVREFKELKKLFGNIKPE